MMFINQAMTKTIPQMRYELTQFTAKAMIDFDTPQSEIETIWKETIAEMEALTDEELVEMYNYELGNPND